MDQLALSEMLRPPLNRGMRVLDRSKFGRIVPLSAASIGDVKDISRLRSKLETSKDLLHFSAIKPIISYDRSPSGKCFLLNPNVKHDDSTTWSPILRELVETNRVGLSPYNLELNYDHWSMHDIMTAILPEEEQEETPTGFAIVGHVAHVNLRQEYIPYKHLIGALILDKNSKITTVINKIDDVGSENEFRTFRYEVLAGEDNMDVEVSAAGCEFRFDFSKVYWNSRLDTEHKRIIDKFREGEVVCDVMAGVGPFAVPAGKKKVFVHANDLNPDCYTSLMDAINRNKVSRFVKGYNMDGRKFIRSTAKGIMQQPYKVVLDRTRGRANISNARPVKPVRVFQQPETFDHYIMNLPATAIEFLDAFSGIYAGEEQRFQPHTERRLPMIHVYCFAQKHDDELAEQDREISERISEAIGWDIRPNTPELEIFDVRLVSPKKRMFCASFRLPPQVAFRQP